MGVVVPKLWDSGEGAHLFNRIFVVLLGVSSLIEIPKSKTTTKRMNGRGRCRRRRNTFAEDNEMKSEEKNEKNRIGARKTK